MTNSGNKVDYASVLTEHLREIETDRALRNASESRFALYCSWILILGFLVGAFLGQVFGSAHAQSFSSLDLRTPSPGISGVLALRSSLVVRSRELASSSPSRPSHDSPAGIVSFQLPLRLMLRQGPQRQIPMIGDTSAWIRNSEAVNNSAVIPMIAIVIDDLGPVKRATERALRLPASVTLSFLPAARGVDDYARRARAGGHEILIHMPMEPMGLVNPGPHALKVSQSSDDIERELSWAYSRLSGYVGINNHMGSKFTRDMAGMETALKHIKAAGLLYLDSRTGGSSVAPALAKKLNLPFAERDVFLDDSEDTSTILSRLMETEAIARRTGLAVAIAHPHDHSLDILEVWLATVEQRGISVVPLTSIIRRRQNDAMRVAAIQ